jgi:CRISPR/Cas system-associated exonuclease Cas4 (RecB family)
MSIKRLRNIYNPKSKEKFRLSRSKIENYLRCPRCFYLDRRLGVGQPSMPPFTLNSTVDHLLKKEFDIHRAKGTAHPLMKHYKIDAVPYKAEKIDEWRENFVGVQYYHEPTNLVITGAIDDVWINPKGELHIVDYKATSKDGKLSFGDSKWHDSYKNQMEIYQWLVRKNEFKVSNIGYFVYVNGKRDRSAFDGKLEFDVAVFPYKGSTDWIEKKLLEIKQVLDSDTIPGAGDDCEYCEYRQAADHALRSSGAVQDKLF